MAGIVLTSSGEANVMLELSEPETLGSELKNSAYDTTGKAEVRSHILEGRGPKTRQKLGAVLWWHPRSRCWAIKAGRCLSVAVEVTWIVPCVFFHWDRLAALQVLWAYGILLQHASHLLRRGSLYLSFSLCADPQFQPLQAAFSFSLDYLLNLLQLDFLLPPW